jgi:uncharacterized membrane protein
MNGTAFANSILTILHVLAGAAWFGAMIYSFFLLHPRARAYFSRPTDFEAFIATVSHGARWKVLAGLGLIAVSGAGLMVLRWPEPLSVRWLTLLGIKAALFVMAVVLFWYVSWRLWPARVLATQPEIPRFQALFQRVASTMILIAAVSMALGVLAHTW